MPLNGLRALTKQCLTLSTFLWVAPCGQRLKVMAHVLLLGPACLYWQLLGTFTGFTVYLLVLGKYLEQKTWAGVTFASYFPVTCTPEDMSFIFLRPGNRPVAA